MLSLKCMRTMKSVPFYESQTSLKGSTFSSDNDIYRGPTCIRHLSSSSHHFTIMSPEQAANVIINMQVTKF